MKQLLITQTATLKLNKHTLTEAISSNDGRLIIKGVLQRADAPNQNGRVYPKEILEQQVNKYREVFIAERRAFGELDHPEKEVVELKNACINILDLWWEGVELWGSIEVLTNLPSGKIVQGLLEHELTVGISSRGVGSVKPIGENTVEVQDDFEIICWDIVSNPSTHKAFVGTLKEARGLQDESILKHLRINEIINEIISLS